MVGWEKDFASLFVSDSRSEFHSQKKSQELIVIMEEHIPEVNEWGPEVQKLIIDGSKAYALKDFDSASDKFSEACEAFAEGHGEDNPTLLFLYGRAMFQIGLTKSDVLGGNGGNNNNSSGNGNGESSKQNGKESPKEKENPNFQLAEDVEEDEDEDEEDGEEEQTEFEIAWEALDAARMLFLREIKNAGDDKAKIKSFNAKLAETYDLLGEVSLESENFPQASQDLLESLKLKQQLYESSSSLISEAHFKLSLAYEFCVEDPESKNKSIREMEQAIASVKDRLKKSATQDVNLVKDLETRLMDLKRSKYDDALEKQKTDALLGLMGQESDMKQLLVDALGGSANDISSLVKKKPSAASGDKGKGKRKPHELNETETETETEPTIKKQKTAE